MGWFDKLFGASQNSQNSFEGTIGEVKMIEVGAASIAREKLEKAADEKSLIEIKKMQALYSKDMQALRNESEKKYQEIDDLKLVIHEAKIECKFCTKPQGILLVNFDTPCIQNKKTATIKEKDMRNLVFTGNCTKSPNSASPCASVMQLGEWKDTGSLKIQDQSPLLLKSTIPCNYGGSTIKITDAGQRNEPEGLDTTGVPVPDMERGIVKVFWTYGIEETELDEISKHYADLNLHIQTVKYMEGEAIEINILYEDQREISNAETEISFTGIVDSKGLVKMKEIFNNKTITIYYE